MNAKRALSIVASQCNARARDQKTVALLKTLAMQIKCLQKLESRREKWKLNFTREEKKLFIF